MTAQDLCQACELQTINNKLNLWKTYAKFRKNLWPHKCCHTTII